MEGLTYQQVLADHYEETGKNVLVHQNEYSDEVPAEDKLPDELEDQADFNKFSPRHAPEHHEPPTKQDDKTKLSLVYDKQTQVRLINIDSRFRNVGSTSVASTVATTGDTVTDYFITKVNDQSNKTKAVYNQSSATDYVFKLKEPIKNVISVRLSSIEIPNSFYTFSRARGNVLFQITCAGQTAILEIPAGNWDSTVYPPINDSSTIGSVGFPYVVNSNGSITEAQLYSYPSILWKVSWTINTWLKKINFDVTTNWFICDYIDIPTGKIVIKTKTEVTQFIINWVVDPNAVSDNADVLNTDYPQNLDTVINRSGTTVADFGLGYNLGFRNTIYDSSVPPTNLSRLNAGFPPNSATLVLKQIYAEAILNTTDTNYVFLTLDPDWKVIEQETPDRNQLYAFAKIVIDQPKFTINYDSGANTLTKEYFLKQPTNIHSFPVRLSDPYDQDIDLNGMDFSFTLEVREVLSSALYETMRS